MSWHGGGAGHVASDINDGCCKPLARRRAFVFICNQLSGMGFCCVAALTVCSGVVRFGPVMSWLFCETAHDNAVRNVVSVEGWGAFGVPELHRTCITQRGLGGTSKYWPIRDGDHALPKTKRGAAPV